MTSFDVSTICPIEDLTAHEGDAQPVLADRTAKQGWPAAKTNRVDGSDGTLNVMNWFLHTRYHFGEYYYISGEHVPKDYRRCTKASKTHITIKGSSILHGDTIVTRVCTGEGDGRCAQRCSPVKKLIPVPTLKGGRHAVAGPLASACTRSLGTERRLGTDCSVTTLSRATCCHRELLLLLLRLVWRSRMSSSISGRTLSHAGLQN